MPKKVAVVGGGAKAAAIVARATILRDLAIEWVITSARQPVVFKEVTGLRPANGKWEVMMKGHTPSSGRAATRSQAGTYLGISSSR